jgi:hypothetical protein
MYRNFRLKLRCTQIISSKKAVTHCGDHTSAKFQVIALLPNVVVEWVAVLFHIREVRGSNLGPENGYSDFFRGFSQSLQANSVIAP